MPTKNYSDFLFEQLKDSQIAAEYLSAAIENGSTNEFYWHYATLQKPTVGLECWQILPISTAKACIKCFLKTETPHLLA